MSEVWKLLPGYGDRYEVSNLGRVKRLAREGYHPANRWGKPHRFNMIEKIMKTRLDRYGYVQVPITDEFGTRTLTVHRLVALTFHADTYFTGAQVNHINGDKTDNRPENLEWVTAKTNVQHAFEKLGRKGLMGASNGMHGKPSPVRKITDEQVIEIQKLRADGWSQQKIGDRYGVTQACISDVLRNRCSKLR